MGRTTNLRLAYFYNYMFWILTHKIAQRINSLFKVHTTISLYTNITRIKDKYINWIICKLKLGQKSDNNFILISDTIFIIILLESNFQGEKY